MGIERRKATCNLSATSRFARTTVSGLDRRSTSHNPFVNNGEIALPPTLQEPCTYFVCLGEPKFSSPEVSSPPVDLGVLFFGRWIRPNNPFPRNELPGSGRAADTGGDSCAAMLRRRRILLPDISPDRGRATKNWLTAQALTEGAFRIAGVC